jgi:hypothetical protein
MRRFDVFWPATGHFGPGATKFQFCIGVWQMVWMLARRLHPTNIEGGELNKKLCH